VTTKDPKKYETIAVTEEQVRELLAEGRLVRAELEKRIEKMHRLTVEQRFGLAR
jgi:hypothetical protein